VRVGLVKLSQLILGANTLVQSVLEEVLFNTPKTYYQNLNSELKRNAQLLVNTIVKIPGLTVVAPGGAMYMMFGIDFSKFEDFDNDVAFAKKLLEEESVFVLPGKIFKCENFIRLVICPPTTTLTVACTRIEDFCKRHLKRDSK